MPELAFAARLDGRVGRVCGLRGRALVGDVEVAAELVEVDDVSVLASEFVQFAVELIERALNVGEGGHWGGPFRAGCLGG